MTTTSKPTFTHEQLLKALYFIYDLFSRASVPFFLLDDTADAAKNRKLLEGSQITVGIRQVDHQAHSLSILEAFYLADEVTKRRMRYTYEGVPIVVKVIQQKDPMFTTTDSIMYQSEFFSIPNPYDKYLENRSRYV